jgi:ABC-type nickel/cobalt efflux system permease component RcnA
MIELLPFATAFVLGFVHAVDVDHAVAVSAFVSTRPSLPLAARFGLRWAAGHSLTVLLAGGLLLALGVRLSPAFDVWAERAVGVMLIAVGLWALRSARRIHFHGPPSHGDHAHVHVHPEAGPRHEHAHGPEHRGPRHHPRGIGLVGMVHGLAGTSGVLALLPVTLFDHRSLCAAYLALFSLGVVAGMVLFACVVAYAMTRAASVSVRWGRRIAQAVALTGVAVGLVWLIPR